MMNSKKSIIPVLFILILSLFPALPFVESAGYGEENENLGQFTDDFENDDNVSVAVNVINNQTLDCMELNKTADVPFYIDFDTYTENDAGNKLTQGNTFSNFTALERTRDNTYLRYDYGAGNIDDFVDEFELFIDSATLDDVDRVIAMISSYTDGLGDWVGVRGGNFDQLAVVVMVTNSEAGFRIQVRESFAGSDENTNGAVEFDEDTVYYFRFIKENTNAWCEVYDDSARTNLLENITLSLDADHTFRYHLAPQSADFGTTGDWITGYINNYWNGTVSSGFVSDGYFTTEDYLNYTTGQGLALLTNASIPVGTSMTVQFSNDNATWVDNEGNVGSTPVLDGFYAIDLRDLNYTDSFKMYNLTTADSTITPRLFQSRLVTTNGTAGAGPPGATVIQNVTGEWVYYNLTSINVTFGTHDTGTVNSTLDIDGDTWNCSEVVGAPGYRIRFNWTDVDQDSSCLWVTAYVFYDGVSAHTITIDLWNFTSTAWVTIGTIYDMTGFEWVNSSIYDLRMPNDFINSTGAVLGRFNHASAGNVNDDIHVEFLKLYAFIPFEDEAVTVESFFWIPIAIVLSIIAGLLVWLQYEHK